MRARSRAGNAAAASLAACLSVAAGCAGGRTASGVISHAGDEGAGWRPRKLGLLFPQLAPDAMPDRAVRGADQGARPLMGGEINAVVHAALRDRLGAASRPEVRDLSEAGPGRERMALLTTVLLREYWLNGTLPARPVNELARVSQCDAVLIVSVIKFGRSSKKLMVRNLGGDVRPDAGGQGTDRWVNCGIKIALVRLSNAQPVWEAAYLESRPDEGNSQEMVAAACVEKLVAEFPFRK